MENDVSVTGYSREAVDATLAAGERPGWNWAEFGGDFAAFRQMVVRVIGQRMLGERHRSPHRRMTRAQIREARDQGRA